MYSYMRYIAVITYKERMCIIRNYKYTSLIKIYISIPNKPFILQIIIWCRFKSLLMKFFYHFIKNTFPHILNPIRVSKPFNNSRANCIICTNKGSSIPCFCQVIITESSKRPYLRAIIRTVYTSSNITSSAITISIFVITRNS